MRICIIRLNNTAPWSSEPGSRAHPPGNNITGVQEARFTIKTPDPFYACTKVGRAHKDITFVDDIVQFTETFLKTPLIGRAVSEFNRQDLREVMFRGYRIVPRANDGVLLLRFVHGARDLLELISESLGIEAVNSLAPRESLVTPSI
ncbi:type II toxin-antitoxin system RelE/ParE family toxin [Candidatus Nitrospira nitrificans]|uniref:type II toxin-antitoxin system RelE/ParE family toxin n=1 Tax=Candidatus Nitrospira nitrificans TaxID=1742973 RepID=UPI0038B286FD